MTTPDGNMKNLSGRQARWLEHISEFNFSIEYVPGVENVLADALSRIYSNDRPGTVRAPSEYTSFDEEGDFGSSLRTFAISVPVLVDPESVVAAEAAEAVPGPTVATTRVLRPRPPRPLVQERRARRKRDPSAPESKAHATASVPNFSVDDQAQENLPGPKGHEGTSAVAGLPLG
ncbi:hypothetical protein DICSQDRAFT_171815 [Dichomitus squalens LYAD-421 SS1]|uniref:Reverse transcriptase RNase H-like domain-containing protein n=1 Tax=Dichomitus squalens (strain LYAD-421) TaxID=732165 RepID=R7SXD0_DICSQ|nr:uncharacterized protein DICSQDRAFT_171815 [Dichomitus squalens LYAD-421 SS1]EJF59637.1 hypothetical protein DICSQDRAFT_171815 [Dichomitus squalens LYAD-421 SS1]